MKLLIAEDNKDLSKALVVILEKQGYSVDAVYNGNDALDFAKLGDYDGIILDIMMPGRDGLSVLESLRHEKNETPILILTAKGDVEDRIKGLDLGADDYLPKPFVYEELISRIKAMLRRRNSFKPDISEYNGLVFNQSSLEISYGGCTEHLVNREYQVFEILWENKGRIISTDYLLEHIWGWDSPVEVNVVWVTISNLRKKLNSINSPITINAVRGQGYIIGDI